MPVVLPGRWLPEPSRPGDSSYHDIEEVPRRRGADGVDMTLICIFLIGLYTNYTIPIATKLPFPSAPAGIAGLILLWRRRDLLTPRLMAGLLGVLLLYLVSIFFAPNIGFFSRRLNGLIQLTYSIIIGLGLFLTVARATRSQIAGLFLAAALFIVIGCLFETYGGLRPLSDEVRRVLYRRGIYENDFRDVLFYGRVRPKFFASEPASVTFCYALFSFIWFVTSRLRGKLIVYLGLVAVGITAMPGPTLLLMLLLVLPYVLLLSTREGGRLNVLKLIRMCILSALFLTAFFLLGLALFPERLANVSAGNDPSFFYRVQGPALAGREILKEFPVTGAGLTGEPFIEERVTNVYVRSPAYSIGWAVVSPATELLINYFWLHWIYLGLGFGVVILAALSRWLWRLGVPSPAFCWLVWAVLGQASGAYVGPTCWAVLFLTGAASLLHQQQPRRETLIVLAPVYDLAARLRYWQRWRASLRF